MSQSKSEKTEPAWIIQARELYAKLHEQAFHNEYGELIWEGKLLDLYRSTGASNASYTQIMKLLTELGVIRYRQRGNRHQSTVIEVLGDGPFLQPDELLPPEHLTAAAHRGTLHAESLEREVTALQAWRESLEKGGLDLAKVIQDFELRLTRLERELLNGKSKKS